MERVTITIVYCFAAQKSIYFAVAIGQACQLIHQIIRLTAIARSEAGAAVDRLTGLFLADPDDSLTSSQRPACYCLHLGCREPVNMRLVCDIVKD